MHRAMPPLNALRAFEAAARHLSLTKAAIELSVTASALSHQIRGLEEMLGVALFERRVRSIALTSAGKQLYPGLQTGFMQLREAVNGLEKPGDDRVLVISTPPGFTAKWLAPRLHRLSLTHPEIDVRISSSIGLANFRTDGIDAAIRMLVLDDPPDPELIAEKLLRISFVPVCSPKLIAERGPFTTPAALAALPLIHDDNRREMPSWADWFEATSVPDVDVTRGHRFNSPDHALDMVIEGAGIFLAHDVLAYDELRTGRLVVAYDFVLPSKRGYHFVYPVKRRNQPAIAAFREWIKQEIAALNWSKCSSKLEAARDSG